MAEGVVTTTTEMETQTLMVPKFIKKEAVGKKKTAFKSDIGMMIGYHPEKALCLRIPAYCWDDEKKYPACTPLEYVQAKLNQKIADLNDSDEEITIKDFFKITDTKGDLSVCIKKVCVMKLKIIKAHYQVFHYVWVNVL